MILEPWVLAAIVAIVVIVASYLTALCIISAFRGEPVFRRSRPWWSKRIKR